MLWAAALCKATQVKDTHFRLTELTLVTWCMIFLSVYQYKWIQIMTCTDLA